MKTPSGEPPRTGRPALLARRLLLAFLIAATWLPAAYRLGNRGEVFWLLFPLWVFAGAYILRAIPAPRARHKSLLTKWSVQAVVILFPIGFCFAMASFMGADVSRKEILIAIWFFAASLEILLIYLFQVFDALYYLMTRHDVDPDQIYGFGLSMGASSLLMALPELPHMKAVVADSAFSSLDRMLRHQYRFVPEPLTEVPVALTRMIGWLDAGVRGGQVDAVAAIRGLRVPILFIHGLDDATIPADCACILFDAHGGPWKLRLAPGADHGGTAGLNPERYGRDLRAFFLGPGNE